jgi:hypothetical protein
MWAVNPAIGPTLELDAIRRQAGHLVALQKTGESAGLSTGQHYFRGREIVTNHTVSHEPDHDHLVRAFRDLEAHIHDCVTMSEVAVQLMGEAGCNDGKLAFAVLHLNETLRDLKKHYRAAWAAAEPIPSLRTRLRRFILGQGSLYELLFGDQGEG